MPRERLTLSSGWQWRLANSNSSSKADSIPEIKKWTPASTFPSVIQLELLHAKLLPDPNVGENERLIQWVGEADWEYSCAFPTPDSAASRDKIELLFEGLDTFATVQLNGKQILQSDNMFIPYRVDIKDHLQPSGTDNEIVILFESAFKKGQELEKTYGQRISIMRDPKRMHIRKAQVSTATMRTSD
jgi:beta-mannosidase